MIYPTNIGKSGEHLRLATLESVWIQGKLRMWGRWSYIGGGKIGSMFNRLLVSHTMTKSAINEALRSMKKSGIEKAQLEAFLLEIINGRQKSWLVHCSDTEALLIDKVIGEVLGKHPGLIYILRQRYEGRGMTKRKMAELLNDAHPEWCFSTCEKRIANWLAVAEYALYIPMRESFAQKTA